MPQDAEFITYSHPTGIFSIDIPSDWTVRDDSREGLALVNFVSPDGQILVRVALNPAPQLDTDEAWATMLQAFVSGTAGQEANFEMEEVEEDEDETLALTYYYDLNDTPHEGDAYAWYEDPYAVMMLVAMPEERWDDAEDLIDDIADSLAIEPEAPLP
jgi:hypothetical protein